MFELIIKIILFLILFKNIRTQIHLNSSNLEDTCSCDLSDATYVNLDYKNVITIDVDTFTGLVSLLTLSLEYNYIATIEADTFSELNSLQYLSLAHNQITTITGNLWESFVYF